MNKTSQLRSLPSVDEVLRSDDLADLRAAIAPRQLTDWVRNAISVCREQILAGSEFASASAMTRVIDQVRRQQQRDAGHAIQPVINATGVVLHTNLGRAPLADRAIQRVRQAARYANVELDLQSGRRSKRGGRVLELLARISGAEAAVVVNNCAAATILVLQAIASGRDVVVSRGQLVEIGGGFRLPDVFRSAGVVLREVGTTNRTYLRDYEAVVGPQTGAIIRVHRSNFHLSGFVTEPTIDELVTIERENTVPVIDDLGSGCIEDLAPMGLHEPTVPESVRSGADLTLFSGDKLFGGPQCGIIVGRQRWIEVLSTHPMMRALRVDKLTLAALEATAEIHLAGNAFDELPILKAISEDAQSVRARCDQLVGQMDDGDNVSVVPCRSPVGGGSLPGTVIDSYALKIAVTHPDRLAAALRNGTPAVQARVTDDGVVLDLRTVPNESMKPLADRLCAALRMSKDRDSDA